MIRIDTPTGSLYVRPECVAAVTDFCPDGQSNAIGVCVLQLVGGSGIVVGLSKDAAIERLGIPYTVAANGKTATSLRIINEDFGK